MQFKRKIFCTFKAVELISANYIFDTKDTISVVLGQSKEAMIFLGMADNNFDFEVRIYKYSSSDKYVPYKYDRVKSYEENDEYATFFFEEYTSAVEFVSKLNYRHREYCFRPARNIISFEG